MVLALLRWLVAAGAGGAALLVVFSLLGRWIPAADTVGHFRHFLTPAAGILGAWLLLLAWRRLGLAAIAAAIVGAASMGPTLLDGGVEAPGPCEGDASWCDLRLVQANLYFDNNAPAPVVALAAGADVLTVQELSPRNPAMRAALAVQFPEQVVCPLTSFLHVAVMTHHRVRDRGCAGEGLAWMRIEIGDRLVTVASLHLHWPWPFGQPTQLAALEEALSDLPRPVVLAGDFNAAPWSAAVRDVGAATATRIVPGLRTTIVTRIPFLGLRLGLPIDHVMLPEGARATAIELGPDIGSDHRPIVVRIALP